MKVLVSIFLLFFAVYGCGSDSPSTPTGQQPVVDDSDDHPDVDDDPDTGDIDITDAIFTKRDGSCTDYASMYVSDVKDAQSGTSFAGDGFPIFGSCINDGGSIRPARSSYVLKDDGGLRQDVADYTTPVGGRGSAASSNYDGQFRGDYEYV